MQSLRKKFAFQSCGLRIRLVWLFVACIVASLIFMYTVSFRPRPAPLRPLRYYCELPSVESILNFTSTPAHHQRQQQQQRAASATMTALTSSSRGARLLSYHAWVDSLLYQHFGRAIAEAVYDPEVFNAAARELSGDPLQTTTIMSNPDEFVFTIKTSYPVPPSHFHNISNMLWWNKRLTSIAVARIARDGELQKLHARLAADPNPLKFQMLGNTIVRALSAQVQYFHTVTQLAVDIALTAEVKALLHQTTSAVRADLDALVLISGWISSATTIAELDALFSCRNLLTALVEQRMEDVTSKPAATTSPTVVVPAAGQGLYPIYYDDVAFEHSFPPHGKFWNMIRPTAGCSSIVRACEIPDGCRMLCNGEYLLRAGLPPAINATPVIPSSSSAPTAVGNAITLKSTHAVGPFHHRIIGFGSNNQFDWEMSFMRLFHSTSAALHGNSHNIGWMTSMDCTVTIEAGARQWNVPDAIRSGNVGHSGASMCADGKRREVNLLRPGEVKAFQLGIETSAGGDQDAHDDWPVVRSSVDPAVLGNVFRGTGKEHHAFTMSPSSGDSSSPPSPQPRWFDALTIFKMDIERFEWNFIPVWLYGELSSLGKHAALSVAPGASASIDMEAAIPEFFSVSLFSLEIHRIGEKYKDGDIEGALRIHWFMMHMYGLGFLMVSHEKNEIDQCCFEHTYAHVRHFVRSEMWMALREEL